MIQHPAFAVEPWAVRETELDLDRLAQTESVLALANGHVGMRANLDEEWVELIWAHAILPYLGEQFFGEEDRLAEFALDALRFGPVEDEREPGDEIDSATTP